MPDTKTAEKELKEQPRKNYEIEELKATEEEKDIFENYLKVDLTPEQKDKLLKDLVAEIDDISTARKDLDLEGEWDENEDQYNGILAEKTYPHKYACFHKDVEILTETGWKYVRDVRAGEKAITRELVTGKMSYQPITETQVYYNVPKLIHLESRAISLMVTPNHKMLDEDFFNRTSHFIEAKDLTANCHLPKAGVWESEPAYEFWGYDANAFLEFLGWYISEGWVWKTNSKNGFGSVGIAQINEEKKEWIRDCLARLGVSYSERPHCFIIQMPKAVVMHLRSLGKSYEKYIPDMYLDLPPHQLKILFDTLIAGDGSRLERKDRLPRIYYSTTSKRLADNVQELVLKIGLVATIAQHDYVGRKMMMKHCPKNPGTARHIIYFVRLCYSKYIHRCKISPVDYNDSVYCVTVPPYHTVFVRQNGKPIWTGQSNENVPLTGEKTDAVTARASRAIFGVDPIITVEPVPEGSRAEKGADIEIGEKKEQWLEYSFKNEMLLEEALDDPIFSAGLHGTGILKLVQVYEKDRRKDIEEYDGTKGMKDFLANYPDAEKDYAGLVNKLKKNEKIEVIVEYDFEDYNGPKGIPVSIRDFIVHPDVTDLNRCHIHGDRYWLTGNELMEKERDEGYDISFRYEIKDGQVVDIKDFLTNTYTYYHLIYKYAFKGEKIEKKYAIDIIYDDNHNVTHLLKIINYPYWHNRSCYIPFYISKRKKGFYRDGLAKIIRDPQRIANILLNILLDSGIAGVAPGLKAKLGKQAELAPQLRKGWYPGVTFWVSEMDDIQQFQISVPNINVLFGLLSLPQRFAEQRTGVTFAMSGRESPTDPDAPAAKTRMLLGESNIRVGDYVKVLQRSLREVAFQTCELTYQYQPRGKLYSVLGKDGKPAFPQITRKELRARTTYIPHGTAEVLDKPYWYQMSVKIYEILLKNPWYMGIASKYPVVIKTLIANILRNAGGDWDKQINKVLPTEDQIKDYQAEVLKEALKKMQAEQQAQMRQRQMNARIKQLAGQGADRETIRATIAREFPPERPPEGGGQ